MTPRGIKPVRREPALTPLELASMPGGPHCDSLLAIEEALTDSRQGVVSEVVAALRATTPELHSHSLMAAYQRAADFIEREFGAMRS